MPVIVTIKGQRLSDVKLSTQELMREVGLLARERILRRTAAGLDQNESAFQPYSAAYALKKGGYLGAAGVNLQVSGAMLGAIIIAEVTENKVTLGFSS